MSSSMCSRSALPELLGDERHERVEQPQAVVEHVGEHAQRPLVAGVEAHLRHLDVPVAELVPEEVLDLRGAASPSW